MIIVEQSVECELAGEREVLGENLPQWHLVRHKSHMIDLDSNLGRRRGKPVTNRLGYGTAQLPPYWTFILLKMSLNGFVLFWCIYQPRLYVVTLRTEWTRRNSMKLHMTNIRNICLCYQHSVLDYQTWHYCVSLSGTLRGKGHLVCNFNTRNMKHKWHKFSYFGLMFRAFCPWSRRYSSMHEIAFCVGSAMSEHFASYIVLDVAVFYGEVTVPYVTRWALHWPKFFILAGPAWGQICLTQPSQKFTFKYTYYSYQIEVPTSLYPSPNGALPWLWCH
jgi:hypothetical protein